MPGQGTRTIEQKPSHIYTVSELTKDLKLVLESSFPEVWVEGEVSGLSRIPTGTVFFNLKDSASLLKCVIFYSTANSLKFELKDGIQLVCFGRIGIYERDGKYQLYVDKLEPKGLGSLQLALEQLKLKLEKEGLFRLERKRKPPALPRAIGIVTSLTGAAIKDMLKVLERRFGDARIIIRPAQVQGEGAKEDIAQSIKDLNDYNAALAADERIEVMIVGRGGGSIEDLWAFNEEIVARAIYNSKIPVISAVGHERDWTIADLVADVRAATPSVAAELVMPKKDDLLGQVRDLFERMTSIVTASIQDMRQDLDHLAHRFSMAMNHSVELNEKAAAAATKKLFLLNPRVIIQQYTEKIEGTAKHLGVSIGHYMQLRSARFGKAVEKLSNLSPVAILGRGYSITFSATDNRIIKDARLLHAGDEIKTRLNKGDVLSIVKEITEHGRD